MKITWTKCADEMPPNYEHLICKDSKEVHITHGLLIKDYYDDYVVESMQWTPYTKEKWEYLNK